MNKPLEQIIQPQILKAPPAGEASSSAPKAVDLLLKVEADARQVETVGELEFLVANETSRLARGRQVIVVALSSELFKVKAVTGIGAVDRNAPRIRWLESIVASLNSSGAFTKPQDFALPAHCPPDDVEHKSFPYAHMLWVPFTLRDGHVFAGMLLARETPWSKPDKAIPLRLGGAYAHAWAALAGEKRLKRTIKLKPFLIGTTAIALLAGFFPVSMTVLAPAEVVPIAPRIIAAPMEGVVDTVLVNPDQTVRIGQPLVQLSDVVLRNELAVAEQNMRVSQAKVMQVTQGAVSDPKLRAELAIARSELTVAAAKRDYAQEMLLRAVIRAPTDGVAIFTDKRDWIGKPVMTGERIMQIANPAQMQIKIDVPVADAIAVKTDAPVRAFLDSNPLSPENGKIVATSFEARMVEGDVLAYRVYASFDAAPENVRLGIRGTAQISGDRVALAYYLFRKPIAVIRQRLGL